MWFCIGHAPGRGPHSECPHIHSRPCAFAGCSRRNRQSNDPRLFHVIYKCADSAPVSTVRPMWPSRRRPSGRSQIYGSPSVWHRSISSQPPSPMGLALMWAPPNTAYRAMSNPDWPPKTERKFRPPVAPMPRYLYAQPCRFYRGANDHPYRRSPRSYRGRACQSCKLWPMSMSILPNTTAYICNESEQRRDAHIKEMKTKNQYAFIIVFIFVICDSRSKSKFVT